jgi:hypothetical protein
MEAFGTDYVSHNLPLLILSGLGTRNRSQSDVPTPQRTLLHEGGFRLKVDLPPIENSLAEALRDAFLAHDGSDALWRSQSPSSSQAKLFKIQTVGRVGQALLENITES